MHIVVCVKRVPALGAQVPLTDDGLAVDTRHLGFTIGPHEECAIEEAVRLVAAYGGTVTVVTVGPPDAAEQLRYALAMGADRAVLVDAAVGAGDTESDPQETADALRQGLADEPAPDLVLVGDSSADAGHGQVGIRLATALGLPAIGGIKGLDVAPAGSGGLRVRASREADGGVEVFGLDAPAVIAVKEGLNLPRYPTLPGRLKAKKAELRTVHPDPAAVRSHGLRTVGLRMPEDRRASAIPLGRGADAAPAVVDVLARLGKV
ncbi:electron transfer flavoprotein subunit alpha [Saccharomonospora sp. CUA-673]|uniref:electron transfer flavoprotein subunit beta/FixA family protein n=1 Tax=Saccharomonospora sp. CUA-673 TaxID=1904969 RepID=UPI00095AE232|nr:electron transfer flavoprotein subunit alpha [Saccharomonospora sp. CUA-673]OLT48960.1 electron transfer flavoprotein subunit alpha [Saccharomonospora sp. CUA-673]